MTKKYWFFICLLILIIALAGCSSKETTESYTLSAGIQPEGSGELVIEPEKDRYQEGEEVNLTATAAAGYEFDHWEGSGFEGNTDNPLKVVMMSDLTLVAVFLDSAGPGWVTEPYISTPADTGSVGISLAVDENGTVFYKVLSDGVTAPTAVEVKATGNSTSVTADTETEITIEGLNSGTNYDIYFTVEDSTGNLQEDSAVKKVEVNTGSENTNPVIESITNVTDGQAEITEGQELVLTVNASDADGNSLTYSISGADADKFSQSANSFSWTPPYDNYSSDNSFAITLEVSDGTDTTSSNVVVTVNDDLTAPAAPAVEDISAGTYNTDQSFTISGESGATIEYSLDNGTNWATYTTEVTISTEGSYDIIARQTDQAGNVSAESSVITVTIDKTIPEWVQYPYITTPADTTSVGISTAIDEDGTIYYKVMPDGAASPTAAGVKIADNPTQVNGNIEEEINITGLDPGTAYDIYFIAEDSPGNLQDDSDLMKVNVKTTVPLPEMIEVSGGTTTADNGSITVAYDYEIGKYELTNIEFLAFLNNADVAADGTYQGREMIDLDAEGCQIGHDGSSFYLEGWAQYPLIEVTWYGAVAYCNWLSEQEGLPPAYDLSTWKLKANPESLGGYRLPTESEWEYAARGGSGGLPTTYAGSNNADEVAWHYGNSDAEGNSNLQFGQGTMPVGQKAPNELGTYDMSGNVFEWTDPLVASRPEDYKYFGGNWRGGAEYTAVNYSTSYDADNHSSIVMGFRPVRTIN